MVIGHRWPARRYQAVSSEDRPTSVETSPAISAVLFTPRRVPLCVNTTGFADGQDAGRDRTRSCLAVVHSKCRPGPSAFGSRTVRGKSKSGHVTVTSGRLTLRIARANVGYIGAALAAATLRAPYLSAAREARSGHLGGWSALPSSERHGARRPGRGGRSTEPRARPGSCRSNRHAEGNGTGDRGEKVRVREGALNSETGSPGPMSAVPSASRAHREEGQAWLLGPREFLELRPSPSGTSGESHRARHGFPRGGTR